MKVAPSPDPVVPPQPRVTPPRQLTGQLTAISTGTRSSHGPSKTVTAKASEDDFLHQYLAVSCTTCCFGLLSALSQIREDNLGYVAAGLAGSGTCLLFLVLCLGLRSKIEAAEGWIEVLFVCQVLVMNVTIMIVPLSHEDPMERAVYLAWHSAVFKLLPLACARISCSIIQLAGSCAIDAALHLLRVVQLERSVDYDLQSIAFLVSVTCYVAIFCFFQSRRRKRSKIVEQGMQDLLDKVLTEVFTSWALLDEHLNFQRTLADTKSKRLRSSIDPVLDLLTECMKAESLAASQLREAFQSAQKNPSKATRFETSLCRPGREEQHVELLIFRAPSGVDSKSRADAEPGSNRRVWSPETGFPSYVVGVVVKPPPVSEAALRPPSQRVDSLVSEEGGSADASVLSGVARDRRLLGEDNRSSSIFDIPVRQDENIGDKSFAELVELGRREHWIVEPHQLCLLENKVLGSGTFGTVLGGTFYGASVAIKMPNSDKKEHLPLLNELRTLRRLRHPNIVLFLAAHVTPASNDMALVFELMEGPTLHDWMKAQPHPIEFDPGKLSVLRDISLALRYLHQQDKTLVHGDLKGSNVFVEGTGDLPRAKLGDFGLSRFLYKTEHVMGGSLRWMAPEIATGHDRSPSCKADLFSLGALMSFALTDIKPFEGVDRNQILSMMRKGKLPRLNWPPTDTEQLSQLVRTGDMCYNIDPSKRPDIMHVLEVLDWCHASFEPCSPSVLT